MPGFADGPLTDLLTPDSLAGHQLDWAPFPTITDRERWARIPDGIRAEVCDDAETAAAQVWPEITASLWQDYLRTGIRTRYEDAHFGRRQQLTALVCRAGVVGTVDDPLVDRLWALMEESSWCLPPHDPQPLPDVTRPVVDLFAAQTGALVALAHQVLGPALDRISPHLRHRMAAEVDQRILTPYRTRDDWRWFGVERARVNNWNPWINLNVAIAGLCVLDDPQSRRDLLVRIGHSVDTYLACMPTDGGCTEGQSYWTLSAAKVCDLTQVIDQATDGAIAATSLPQVVAAARYPVAMHIDGRFMVQHADGGGRVDQNPQLFARYGRAVDNTELQALARHLRDLPREPGTSRQGNLWERLNEIFDLDHLTAEASPAPYRGVSWFETTQVLTVRERSGTSDGLFLAVKGGHNAEEHNHNDVGSFSIALDGQPLIVDTGANTYTAQTFGPRRYDLWTMQSSWHNLPRINGQDQLSGDQFRAGEVSVTGIEPDAITTSFDAELARAWGSEVGLQSWRRHLELDRHHQLVRLTDHWDLTEPYGLDLPLVCAAAPQVDGATTRVGDLVIDHPGLAARVEIQPIPAGDRLEPTWGRQLWRLVLHPETPQVRGSWQLSFHR